MIQKVLLCTILICLSWTVSELNASSREEIRYLLKYGQKVLIEGTRRGERKWDYACRISQKSNYVAIVQSDTANYRIVPAPRGQLVEKICPEDIFKDAIRWYGDLQKSSY